MGVVFGWILGYNRSMNDLALEKKLKKLIEQRDALATEILQLTNARLNTLISEFAQKNKIPICKVGVKIVPLSSCVLPQYEFYILSEVEMAYTEALKRQSQLECRMVQTAVKKALGVK